MCMCVCVCASVDIEEKCVFIHRLPLPNTPRRVEGSLEVGRGNVYNASDQMLYFLC